MTDIHLHIDGSLSISDFEHLSNRNGIRLPNDFPNCIFVNKDCKSLDEYLEKFDLPLQFLQDEYSLEYVTYSLVKRLYKLGYIYAELRYAPLLHLSKGLTMEQVVKATINGLNKALKETEDFDANLILCCMRHASEELNLKTVEMAYKFKDEKVVAVDLAGGEAIHSSSYFKKVFSRAKELGLNITIHAGESTDSNEIMQALDNGAMRIGHGVHLSLDSGSIKRVKDKKVLFEFCPTSNLQTKSLKSYSDVPLREFINNGIDVCINSDNMTVSNVTAINDMKNMISTFELTKNEVYKLYENAINHAFVTAKEKENLKNILKVKFESFYSRYLNG